METATLNTAKDGEQPYYPPRTKALLTASSPCISQNQSAFLTKLPREVRHRIYHFIFTSPEPPRMLIQGETGGADSSVKGVPTSVMYTCRQTFIEAWPELTSSLVLFLTYKTWDPRMPPFMPPTCVCCNIRKIVLVDRSDDYEGRLEELPDFSRLPALHTFVIRRTTTVFVLLALSEEGMPSWSVAYTSNDSEFHLGASATRYPERPDHPETKWGALTDRQKLQLLENNGMLRPSKIVKDIQMTNQDNWISKLVEQGRKYDGDWTAVDVMWDHRWRDYEDPENWPTEEDEAAEEEKKVATAVAAEEFGRAVMSRMTTLVEMDYQVTYDNNHSGFISHYLDVLHVVLDVDTQTIADTRWLSTAEITQRAAEIQH